MLQSELESILESEKNFLNGSSLGTDALDLVLQAIKDNKRWQEERKHLLKKQLLMEQDFSKLKIDYEALKQYVMHCIYLPIAIGSYGYIINTQEIGQEPILKVKLLQYHTECDQVYALVATCTAKETILKLSKDHIYESKKAAEKTYQQNRESYDDNL